MHGATAMAVSRGGRPAAGCRWTAALAWTLAALPVLALVPAGRLAALADPGLAAGGPTVGVVAAVVLATVSTAAVGALLASRRPRHPVGWLLLGVALGLIANILVQP